MLGAGSAMTAAATLGDEDGHDLPQRWEGDDGIDARIRRLGSLMGG